MAGLMALLLCIGFLFGNLNALAMEPMGHIAGTAAAIIGALTTLLSSAIGVGSGILYNETLYPLSGSFLLFGLLTGLTIVLTDRNAPPAAATLD